MGLREFIVHGEIEVLLLVVVILHKRLNLNRWIPAPKYGAVIRSIEYDYLISAGGPPPDPIEFGDAACIGDIDIDDVAYLISYIFSGGNSPCDADWDGVPDC